MILQIKNYLRPRWLFRKPTTPFQEGLRSPLYRRNEALYLWPAMQATDPKIRAYILRCLEPSHKENGEIRSSSGQGFSLGTNAYLDSICAEVQPELGQTLQRQSLDRFPVRKLYNLTEEYLAVWEPDKVFSTRAISSNTKSSSSERRGAFPFVDESNGLIKQLRHADIFYTRNRVRDWRHPKWRVHQYWRRKFFNEYIARRRANEREAVLAKGSKSLA